LQTLGQSSVFFGQTFQALIGIHIHILALNCLTGQSIGARKFSTIPTAFDLALSQRNSL
jgi:hypothetical protein